MTFDLPHAETLAPALPLLDLNPLSPEVQTVSVYGKARGLARLKDFRRLHTLWISGLTESQADIVGALPELKSLVIHDLRPPSLRNLAGLKSLERLAICGVSRLKTLEGIQSLQHLRELFLVIVTGLESLDPLSALDNLEVLSIDGGLYKNLRLPSFKPLSGLSQLRRLRLAGVSVVDRSLRPLHDLSGLRDVFIGSPFSRKELVALAAALPFARGEMLDSLRGDAA
jgi:hypothetical protein